jgi:toxin-antitoxin system PIN domain toxin
MISLLDANVLIALFDSRHVHSVQAQQWLAANRKRGWASCALTQSACMRILSQPSYPSRLSIPDIARRMQLATQASDHRFWQDSLQPCDAATFYHQRVTTSKHLTDIYLLALCVENGGRLVTFDQGIPLDPVPRAQPKHLLVL